MFRQPDKKIPQHDALYRKFLTVFLPQWLGVSTHLGLSRFSDYFPLSEIEKTDSWHPLGQDISTKVGIFHFNKQINKINGYLLLRELYLNIYINRTIIISFVF
jgi:hypothetical protein